VTTRRHGDDFHHVDSDDVAASGTVEISRGRLVTLEKTAVAYLHGNSQPPPQQPGYFLTPPPRRL